jgi:DNA-binding LytR/AlgR family response regulator
MARILVIDDDDAIRTVSAMLLGQKNHEVVTAQNGLRGLKVLENDDFDLLIVDLFMPEMDGLETIRIVRRTIRMCRSSSCQALAIAPKCLIFLQWPPSSRQSKALQNRFGRVSYLRLSTGVCRERQADLRPDDLGADFGPEAE